MLDFSVDPKRCTGCGQCAADCPTGIISLEGGNPELAPERQSECYRCQHCLAVCPTGALSILGLDPTDSLPLPSADPGPSLVEALLKGRRAVRRYRDENLEPERLQRLLEVACYAPTGLNSRQVRFTVVDDRVKLAALRDQVMAGLGRLLGDGALPEGMEFYGDCVRLWEESRTDVIFRGAPHLLIASAPAAAVTPVPDCLIALSGFELLAQSQGVGTLWDGLATWAIDQLLPETRTALGIPEDHVIGYAMVFGKPAVRYPRSTQRVPAQIHRI